MSSGASAASNRYVRKKAAQKRVIGTRKAFRRLTSSRNSGERSTARQLAWVVSILPAALPDAESK
jgi:hypothetical protein